MPIGISGLVITPKVSIVIVVITVVSFVNESLFVR